MPDPTSSGATLRRAGDTDAEPIRELVHAAYLGYTPLLGRTPLPMLADYAVVVREHDTWALVDEDDRIVGVIELVPRDGHLWVENVAIAPSAQGRGHGRRLLRHAEDEARLRGLSEMRLLTNERYVANIAMYERYGYRETHREPYLGTDLVYFRKDLGDDGTAIGGPPVSDG
jgi:ribosomal protein S18 acetylase RimI-like enzyme